jgi:hypothetical protein
MPMTTSHWHDMDPDSDGYDFISVSLQARDEGAGSQVMVYVIGAEGSGIVTYPSTLSSDSTARDSPRLFCSIFSLKQLYNCISAIYIKPIDYCNSNQVLLKDPRSQPPPDLSALVEDTLKVAGVANMDTRMADMEKKSQDDRKQKILDYEEEQKRLNAAAATVLKALREQEVKDAAKGTGQRR